MPRARGQDRIRGGQAPHSRRPRHGRAPRADLVGRPSGRGVGPALHRSARDARRRAAKGVRLHARRHGERLDVVVDSAARARRARGAHRGQRARVPAMVLPRARDRPSGRVHPGGRRRIPAHLRRPHGRARRPGRLPRRLHQHRPDRTADDAQDQGAGGGARGRERPGRQGGPDGRNGRRECRGAHAV
jgi:hypothetical protein